MVRGFNLIAPLPLLPKLLFHGTTARLHNNLGGVRGAFFFKQMKSNSDPEGKLHLVLHVQCLFGHVLPNHESNAFQTNVLFAGSLRNNLGGIGGVHPSQ